MHNKKVSISLLTRFLKVGTRYFFSSMELKGNGESFISLGGEASSGVKRGGEEFKRLSEKE